MKYLDPIEEMVPVLKANCLESIKHRTGNQKRIIAIIRHHYWMLSENFDSMLSSKIRFDVFSEVYFKKKVNKHAYIIQILEGKLIRTLSESVVW